MNPQCQALLQANTVVMTKLLKKALEAVRRLPPDSQDEIARTILALAASDAEAEPLDHWTRRIYRMSWRA